ncbi:MAG TPA: hypothetical protein PLL69_01565 [Gemmatimonadales bacterium]|nr:hypothetical protein [Gemmatimonadales bacterium]
MTSERFDAERGPAVIVADVNLAAALLLGGADAAVARQVLRREFLPAGDAVLRLVSESRCSADDCEYLSLARELGVPLVTSDRQVLGGFPGIAVSPNEFVAAS